jgi:hypothetical protein
MTTPTPWSMVRSTFLVVSYLVELALVVFAGLALFRYYTVNWWIILLNAWQLVYSGGFLLYQFRPCIALEFELRNYMSTVVTASVLLVIMHSAWQIAAEHSDTEDISAHNESHLFQTYLGLAGTRIAVFVLATGGIINALFFRSTITLRK